MDSVNLIEEPFHNQTLAHTSCSLLKSSVPNGCINGAGEFKITPMQNNTDLSSNNEVISTINNNGDDSSQTKSASVLVKEKINTSTENTKILFYEMMIEILKSQLEIYDHISPFENMSIYDASNSKNDKSQFPRLKDSENRPYLLQPSMFPMLYPTVFFVSEDNTLSAVPNEIKLFLRWKMTTITANTMKAIVLRSGYKMISADKNNKNKSFNNWNAIWCKHLKISEFSNVGYHQRVNHFPGSFNFGRKDRLWLNLKAKSEKYGYDVFGSFHPRTFILPQDYHSLIDYWKKSNIEEAKSITNLENGESENGNTNVVKTFGHDRKVFICKPPASARGQGINIVSTVEELNLLMSNSSNNANNQQINRPKGLMSKKAKFSMVVQEYISNPCLLHNEAKFDLRVYVLVTSISPLRLYVYEEGIVRFAANRYTKSINDIKNQFIHLTNYSVNKNCVEYVSNNSTDGQDGHKWTLKTLWKYLSMMGKVNVEEIWQRIIDLIVKTVICVESQILTLLKQHLKNKRSCFELLGFDIMLDENFKLWLIEVNITPSLRADSVLDFSVKDQLVKDILNTIGYQISPRFRKFYNFGQFVSPDKNDLLTQMKIPNEDKHRKYETLFLSGGFPACSDIINELNDDDVFHLMESEDEFARTGQFCRIFPTANSRQYLQYFDFPYYYNLLLIVWEEFYQNKRMEGIQRLRSYMLNQKPVQENYEKLKNQLVEVEKTLTTIRNTLK